MKLIIVTPAGREKYLRLLAHHVLGSPEVSEWHLWDNCRTAADRVYLRQLAATDPRCRIKETAGADGSFKAIGEFFRFCDDPEALYLRFDDDVVYVEDGFFPRFIARAMAERGKALWFAPLIVNNAICGFMIKHLSRVSIDGPISCQAMCPHAWAYPGFPEALHPVFIEAIRTGRLDDFRVPDREVRMARFSVNAFGFFGSEKMALGDMFCPPGDDIEEEWLTAILPAKLDRGGKVLGDLLVAHFSFHTQERRLLQTGILEAYYELAGLAPPVYEKPRGAMPIAELLRPWRRRRRGPTYRIGLRVAAAS